MEIQSPSGGETLTEGVGNPAPPVAVIVGVGDELLLGHTVDTNGAWLSARLSDLGFRVLRRLIVGDTREEIRDALSTGLDLADLTVFTGGLGPTLDDLTRPTVAEALNAPLEEDPAILGALRSGFRDRGYGELPETTRLMAQVPRGARVLANPQGAAPGLVLRAGEKLCILLPGPPRELKGIYTTGVEPVLRRAFENALLPAYHRTIHTTGIPESLLARRIQDLLPQDLGPLSIAFLPDRRGVRLRFTVRGESPEEAGMLFDGMEERLNDLLEPYRYESETGDLAEAVARAMTAAGEKMAVAESCTGGLVAKRLTDVPGSSKFFLGGLVAYSNDVKIRELGVSAESLEVDGAVSRGVAEQMARGVVERFHAAAGIGITGIAGPGGGTEEKPVGTVWYAVRLGDRTEARMSRFPGDRDSVREMAAQAALALLLRMLQGKTS